MTTPRTIFYNKLIVECTGCALEQAPLIQECMRNDIFHSTLDWLTRQQFKRGAIQAIKLLKAGGEL